LGVCILVGCDYGVGARGPGPGGGPRPGGPGPGGPRPADPGQAVDPDPAVNPAGPGGGPCPLESLNFLFESGQKVGQLRKPPTQTDFFYESGARPRAGP